MDIYVAHSTNYDYRAKLYDPIRDSKLDEKHNFILPHEDSDNLFNSKEFLQSQCDLVLAEVSEASTGQGIELGWADLYNIPILCVYETGSTPSGSLKAVSENIKKYQDTDELINTIKDYLEK